MLAYSGAPAKRYVYLFALDRAGNGTLLYPASGAGSVENEINFLDDVPDPVRFTIPARGYLFESVATTGGARPEVDTFVLLTTAEPLADPSILSFGGVRAAGATPTDPLARMLYDTGGGTRGTRTPVPTDWSIERAPMISTQAR
jgi:hypothetical protein